MCQRLGKRNAQVHLVQDHEAVVACKAGMNRSHAPRRPVAAKEQARTELIHGRHYDPRLVWTVGPLVLYWDATPQRGHSQRLSIAQRPQTIFDPLQDPGLAAFDLAPYLLCPLVDLIHYNAPINHKHNPPRKDLRLGGHGKYSNVKHGGLTGTCRQVNYPRPRLLDKYLPCQALLPGKRIMAMNVPEECCKVTGRQCHRI